jgi:hypothetical protein|tara:strand:- start:121 stop:321 length:201 start_codon:yes stop_codon:yes gene_type:complete
MIIRGMSLPLIISCIFIISILIIFPLFVSYRAEKKNARFEKSEKLSEWDKIRDFGNKINNKTKKNK